MKERRFAAIIISVLTICSWLDFASAAPTTQTATLTPGWNAVFLEVQPESADPAVVFNGITDLESVWMWNPKTSTVEFIQDPNVPVPQGSTWLVYYPADPILTNLHAIHGETAYLIKLGGSSDVTWAVTGEPSLPYIGWKPNAFNFTGFHLADGQEPLFDDFFSSSAAHAGQEIYILDNESGNWKKVEEPSTRMKSGEAFWIFCNGYSEFTGPLSVQLPQFAGLHYGKSLQEQTLIMRNHGAADKTVILSLSALNDTVHYWVFDPTNDVAGWMAFPPDALTVPAGDFQKLRLGVKRAGLAADTEYEANMTVTDDEGMKVLLPLSVTGISYAGLWVGNATITKVNEPANVTDAATPVKTGSEFSFRLVMHADESGTVRLLSQVYQMWQGGTWKPDPNDLGKLIIDQPGQFVLFTDDALISNYSGSAMRDGQLVGRRISAPAFPVLDAGKGLMSGSMDPTEGNTLSVTITLGQSDPTNPFMHKYHPDHKSPQSYEVVRNVTLTFQDEDNEGRPITGVPTLGWGSNEIGGIYKEAITGLHRNDLHMEGTFLMRKVSGVETLTTN
ncbi:hypothetical protein D1AOALGA4SA_10605 [Olavius algarvensis Delta 1 endosymbiont]|nr:hypothetical protein D1AOALGA4SA_10605 [Olavius algarvensis Delta 1 endosymbiont]